MTSTTLNPRQGSTSFGLPVRVFATANEVQNSARALHRKFFPPVPPRIAPIPPRPPAPAPIRKAVDPAQKTKRNRVRNCEAYLPEPEEGDLIPSYYVPGVPGHIVADAREVHRQINGLPTVTSTLMHVCDTFRVHPLDLTSRRKFKWLNPAKFAAAYIAYEVTGRSMPKIAQVLGGKDHTSILCARRECVALMARDAGFAAIVEGLIARLGGRPCASLA